VKEIQLADVSELTHPKKTDKLPHRFINYTNEYSVNTIKSYKGVYK